ncbi:unnamed protein product [Acanthoscelides obtectus]|uniref:HTH psq-type domain-containing protein n=1 Tax=Acanthoscelides obtectus TaxID=200917 RepID=A0A9P0P141_ACAOB|nr:unnamed protein product [Acanthoscelides obtectus]CAK1658180.1 hypothetical protein AOBTE_LOCUS20751 [Acanthoscelides obtectus]
MEVVNVLDRESVSVRNLAKRFNIGKTQAAEIAKNKEDIRSEQDLPDFPDIKWYSEHVRESQYLLQIVKCRNTECGRPRSGLFRLLDNMFLSPPVKVKQTVDDLVLDEGGHILNLPVNLALRSSASPKDFLQMPHDYFCPTVT